MKKNYKINYRAQILFFLLSSFFLLSTTKLLAQVECDRLCGKNLVVNGDFEKGYIGFTSGMSSILTDNPSKFGECGGRYAVDNSAVKYSGTDAKGSIWSTDKDHTGNGTFQIVDPPCLSDGVVIWRQGIILQENVLYSFYAWVSNLSESDNLPAVSLRVNSSEISPAKAITFSSTEKWEKICGTYLAPVTGNYIFEVAVGATVDAAIAGDMGLDDVGVFENGIDVENTSSTISPVVCNSYTVPSGDETYTSSGTYSDTIPNSTGCDSVITINLTVKGKTSSTINPAVCKTYTTPSGANTYTASGTFEDVIPNSKGCDSVITINLTVLGDTRSTFAIGSCDSYTVPSGDETYTVSGTYPDTIPNSKGCDSIMTINLSIGKILRNESVESCEVYTDPYTNKTYTESKNYNDTIPGKSGCDTVIIITLTINKDQNSTISETACNTYTAPDGVIYTETGTYTAIIPTSKGCDSTITISLILFKIDLGVVQNSNVLTANQGGAEYQWVDCSNNQAIPNQTSQSFSPESSGQYAVIITKDGCSETSDCISFFKVGLNELNDNNTFNFYPNPISHKVDLLVNHTLKNATIRLIDVTGKIVLEEKNKQGSQFTFDLSKIRSGSYVFEIVDGNTVERRKLMKN